MLNLELKLFSIFLEIGPRTCLSIVYSFPKFSEKLFLRTPFRVGLPWVGRWVKFCCSLTLPPELPTHHYSQPFQVYERNYWCLSLLNCGHVLNLWYWRAIPFVLTYFPQLCWFWFDFVSENCSEIVWFSKISSIICSYVAHF